jgi:hypothetical protein
MKYYEALRIWNDKMGHQMYCNPKKGSKQHGEVIDIQKGNVDKTKAMGVIAGAIKRKATKQFEPAPPPPPKSKNPLGGISQFNQGRIDKGKTAKTGLKKPPKKAPPKAPQPAPPMPPPPDNKEAEMAAGIIAGAMKRKATIQFEPAPKPTQAFDYDNINRIKRFLKDKLILNKYTLKNRINKYKVISKALNELKNNDCLEKKGEGYTIRNIVNLEKRIGTASVAGAIYLTSIPNSLGKFPIASKVMGETPANKLETSLMESITKDILLKGYSKHFNIIYKATYCKDKKVKPKERLVNYNELSNGDLKMLTKNKNVLEDSDDLFNIFFQTFISVGTFHNLAGYYHNDAHFGNFLYQLNNEVGYYHYIHDGKSFYLKSCPYNILIYDYGLSREIKNTSNGDRISIHKDYFQINHAFISKGYGGWVEIKDMPKRDDDNKAQEIKALLQDFVNKARTTPNQFKKDIFTYIIELFRKKAPKGMILLNAPANVLNKQPFYISKN